MNNISSKNNKLAEKLKTIRDPNVRIIYNHEIRLNTIEATVDCLNDITCGEVLKEQKEKEDTYVIQDLNSKLERNSEMISKQIIQFGLIEKNILDAGNKNSELQEKINRDIEDLEKKIKGKIVEKTTHFETIKNENDELKQKIENIKVILKNILMANDDNRDDIIREIENL